MTATAKAEKVEKADKRSAEAEAVKPVPPKVLRTIQVKLSEIRGVRANHRIIGPDDEAKIRRIAASMLENGQQQPIRVMEPPAGVTGHYLWVFGECRMEAAKLNGWTEIRAEVIEHVADEVRLEQIRATENFDRDDLTPLEEAVMVTYMGEAITRRAKAAGQELTPQQVCEQVGIALGKSPPWVRDRMYLQRFPKGSKGYQLLLEGRLPLQHAREVAKAADPTMRDELAMRVVNGEYWSPGLMSIDKTRDLVRQYIHSLGQAPWDTKVAFAGVHACVGCPHNSANELALFDHDAPGQIKAAAQGMCLNAKCWGVKEQTYRKVVESTAKEISKEIKPLKGKERDAELTEKKLEARTPPGIVPQAFAKDAGYSLRYGLVTNSHEHSGGPAKKVKLSPEAEAKAKARARHAEARRKWVDRLPKLLIDALASKPGRLAMVGLLQVAGVLPENWDNAEVAERKMTSPKAAKLLKLLKDPTVAGIGALEAEITGHQRDRLCGFTQNKRDLVLPIVAEAIGLQLPPEPKLADFQPKAKAAKPVKPLAQPGPLSVKCPTCGKGVGKSCDVGGPGSGQNHAARNATVKSDKVPLHKVVAANKAKAAKKKPATKKKGKVKK